MLQLEEAMIHKAEYRIHLHMMDEDCEAYRSGNIYSAHFDTWNSGSCGPLKDREEVLGYLRRHIKRYREKAEAGDTYSCVSALVAAPSKKNVKIFDLDTDLKITVDELLREEAQITLTQYL